MDDRSTRVDQIDVRYTDKDQRTCLIRGVITVQIKSRRRLPDRRIKNQRTRCLAFLKRLSTDQIVVVHHDLTAMTYLKRSTMDHSIVIVDQNDRMVTIKNPLNRDVLHRL